jgi:uncharacterized RDD family membrane protein YckC
MFVATLFSTSHIIRQRNATIFGWLPLVWFVPFLGTFLYLELKILTGNPDLKSSNELDEGRQRPPMVLHEDRRLLWRRVVAAAIDPSVFVSLLGLYARYLGTPTDTGSYEVIGFEAFTLKLVTWMFVFPLPEFFFGATIGKLITGLRVFMQSGAKPTLSSTLKRHMLDVVDIAIILGSIPLTGGREEGPLRMGDRWAKTVVVKRPLRHSSSPIDAL